MKTYYLQVNSETKIITDAIEYPYENYVEYVTSESLPMGLIGGWFKFEDGVIVEYPELKPRNENEDTGDEIFTLEEITSYIEMVIDRQRYDSIWLTENPDKDESTDVGFAVDGLRILKEELLRVFGTNNQE